MGSVNQVEVKYIYNLQRGLKSDTKLGTTPKSHNEHFNKHCVHTDNTPSDHNYFSIITSKKTYLRMLVAQKSHAPALLFNRMLISPMILTVLPSNMSESELSQSFLSSLVFIRAASCNYIDTSQTIFTTYEERG